MGIESQEQRVANAAAEVLRRPGIDPGPRDRASASYPWGLFVKAWGTDPKMGDADKWRCNGFYRTRKAAHMAGWGWTLTAIGKVQGL